MASQPLERFLLLRRSTVEARLDMRPMTSSEIIDTSFRIYQTLGKSILKLTALPAAFTFAGFAFLLFILLPSLTVTKNPNSINTQVGEVLLTLAISLCVALPIIMIGFSLTTGIVVRLVADYINGSMPNERGALRAAVVALKRMIGLTIYEGLLSISGIVISGILLLGSAWLDSSDPNNGVLAGLVAALGFVGYGIGFLIFLFVLGRHALAPAIGILEGLRPIAAIKRSVLMMKGNRQQPSAFGTVASLFCILFFVALILWPALAMTYSLVDLGDNLSGLGAAPVVGEVVMQLLAISPFYAFLWAMVPIWSTCITIMYFERRVRLEGYDIETLARSMVRSRKEIRFEL